MRVTHIGDCSGCSKKRVNIAYGWSTLKKLCDDCNFARLRAGNKARAAVRVTKERKLRHIAPKQQKPTTRCTRSREKDSVVNTEIWGERSHECLECGKPLGIRPMKIFFSHVHGKGARPDLRHVKENIALHCLPCHRVWEFEAREFMPKTLKLFHEISVKYQDNINGRI
jgi:hypothetical protein